MSDEANQIIYGNEAPAAIAKVTGSAKFPEINATPALAAASFITPQGNSGIEQHRTR